MKNNHTFEYGYLPQDEVKINLDKKSLEKDYGAPSFTSSDGKNWYYVKIKLKQDNLAIHKYYDAEIIKVTFDDFDKTKNIDRSLIKNKIPEKMIQESDLDSKRKISDSIIDSLKHLQPTLQ